MRQRWIVLALAWLFACALPAAAQPVLVAADLRQQQRLDGPWHWSIDPYRDGLAGFHGEAPSPQTNRAADISQSAVMEADPRALFEFDMQRSPVTQLPGSWIGTTPEMRLYQGLVWYQRDFTARAARPGTRVFLRIGAAEYHSWVFLNGKRVGEHRGGYTPFAFDVTALLRDGRNQITIGVDSVRTADDVPPPVTDWETYGGITRSIALVTVPETWVDDAFVRLTPDGTRIALSVKLEGPEAAGRALTFRIADLGTALTGTTDATGRWEATLPVPRALQRWSPEHPRLYDVAIDAGADHFVDRIGFRTIAVRGTDILLNGKPIFLRGVAMHEEELGRNPVRAMTPAASRALLDEIKHGLHGNFVRLAHYPHSEVTLRLADAMGLLVWSEVPVYWMVNWTSPATLADARRMLAENIRRDRNRAAIILWSVANETPVGDARNAFLRTMIGDVRALDPSRLVTAALLSGRQGRVMTIDDPLASDLDVMAVNTYNGWYTPDALADLPSLEWRAPPGKPLIFSEFGAGALAGFHDPSPQPHKFSEEYQADYYRQTLAMAAKIPFLRGMSPWVLKDFRSPRRQNPVYQQGWNRKGLISETGQHKQAFDVLAADYARRAAASSEGN